MFICPGHSTSDQAHFPVRLRKRDARLKAAVNQIIMGAVVTELLRSESQRCPKLCIAFRKKGSRWHDANYRIQFVVERDALADDAFITTKSPLPQVVAEQNHMVFAVSLFFRKKISPQRGLDAKQPKDIRGKP